MYSKVAANWKEENIWAAGTIEKRLSFSGLRIGIVQEKEETLGDAGKSGVLLRRPQQPGMENKYGRQIPVHTEARHTGFKQEMQISMSPKGTRSSSSLLQNLNKENIILPFKVWNFKKVLLIYLFFYNLGFCSCSCGPDILSSEEEECSQHSFSISPLLPLYNRWLCRKENNRLSSSVGEFPRWV